MDRATVFDSELAAIKACRESDQQIFEANGPEGVLWVVGVSKHQARLALVDRIWPLTKKSRRERDARYMSLLEEAAFLSDRSTESIPEQCEQA